MPKTFPSEKYYDIVSDPAIPGSKKTNIILTERGMNEIAKHYKEKYNVDIEVFSSTMWSGAKILSDLIKKEKEAKMNVESFKVGFVFFNFSAGKHGHAMPVIYEKNNDKEKLFLLDSGQLLGSPRDPLNQGKNFRETLNKLLPNLELWSQFSNRQIDLSSCTTDAMVTLKDGLRLNPTLGAVAEEKFMKSEVGVKFFHMPEELLKTAQIGSFIEKSNADLERKMHRHRIKDSTGKTTGEIMMTLGDFRKQHDVHIVHKGTDKVVGLYTLQKGQRYTKIIQKRWEKEQQADIKLYLAMLANRQFDQTKGYTAEYRENVFISIQKEIKENVIHPESMKHIIQMCDYLDMVNNDKHARITYGTSTANDAKKIEKLLLTMLTDGNHQKLRENLENINPSMLTDDRYIDAVKFAKILCKRADEILLAKNATDITSRHIKLIDMLSEGQVEIGQPSYNTLIGYNFLIDRISNKSDKAIDDLADICKAIALITNDQSAENKLLRKAIAASNFLAWRATSDSVLRENIQTIVEKYSSANSTADKLKCFGANKIIKIIKEFSKDAMLDPNKMEDQPKNELEEQHTRRLNR